MLNKDKLKVFAKDERLFEDVFFAIQQIFLKRKSSDVNYLAAKSLALEFLEDAKKELERYRDNETEISQTTKQVGL